MRIEQNGVRQYCTPYSKYYWIYYSISLVMLQGLDSTGSINYIAKEILLWNRENLSLQYYILFEERIIYSVQYSIVLVKFQLPVICVPVNDSSKMLRLHGLMWVK